MTCQGYNESSQEFGRQSKGSDARTGAGAAASSGIVSDLLTLTALWREGFLTGEEFEAAKRKVLDC